MARKSDPAGKIAAQNRRARYDYAISETVEAGLVLTGSEVKSLRAGKGNINEAYAGARDGEIFLLNAHISEYNQARGGGHEPLRPRKLLLKKREVAKLLGAVQREGMTLVPLKIYFNERGIAKAELGLGRGRKAHDRRERIKERDWQRQKARLMRASLIALAFLGFAATARAEEVTLRFATISQPMQPITKQFYEPWAEKVNAEGTGALKIELRPGLQMANIFNIYARVMNDVVHIGFVLHNYVSGKFNYSEVAALPFQAETSEQASVALWRLYKTGMLDKEYDEAMPLMLIGLPQSLLHATHPPKTIDDWGGMKIIGPTQLTALTTKYMGGTPLTLGSSEIYEALQRGTADGGIVSYNAYQSFKLAEVTRYEIDTNLGTASGMIFLARKTYTALSEAAKKALDDNAGEPASRAWARWWDGDNERGRSLAKADSKHTVVTLNEAQKESYRKKLDGAVAEWAQSRPGVDKVINEYRKILAQVKAGG